MAAMIKLQSYCRFGSNREFATKPPQMRKFVHILGSLFAQVSFNHDSNSWLCYLSSVYDHFHCYMLLLYGCYAAVMLFLCGCLLHIIKPSQVKVRTWLITFVTRNCQSFTWIDQSCYKDLLTFSYLTMLSSWSDLKMLFSSLHWLHNDWMQTMPHTWSIIVTIKPSPSWSLESSSSWWWHDDCHHNFNDHHGDDYGHKTIFNGFPLSY